LTDWATVASFATAGGTLVLAVSTFAAVRFGSQSARVTERALLAGLLPILVPSRLYDPAEKIRFADDHWVGVDGGHATVEIGEGVIYLAIALRNVGHGLALLDRWDFHPRDVTIETPRDPDHFYRLTRDIYVPAGDLGFWQGTFRDESDPAFVAAADAITARRPVTIDLLYGDHEGGQRTISRFILTPHSGSEWLSTVSRHWRLDQGNARCAARFRRPPPIQIE
jgi:hypothetical protein